MADATKTRKPTELEEELAAEQEAVAAAVEAPTPSADPRHEKARAAELARQQDVVDAVAKAHDDELTKLGGPELNPGNPGHDPKTGKPV